MRKREDIFLRLKNLTIKGKGNASSTEYLMKGVLSNT